MKRTLTICPALLSVLLCAFGAMAQRSQESQLQRSIRTMETLLERLQATYVDSLDMEKHLQTGVAYMLRSLDPYTEYYTEEQARQFQDNSAGEYGGIGIRIATYNGQAYLINPMPGQPAFKAGLRSGDKVVRVDSTSTRGHDSNFVTKLIRGQAGTPVTITVVSGLLVSFPALASTFAYVFTMDGYMLALFLAVLAVLFTAKYPRGYLAGAVCLAFSMGIYQAYLPFTILLCVYKILLYFMEEKGWKEKAKYVCHYLGMGIAGGVLYYVILQILLKLQGKVLDTYQGINSMEQMGSGMGILATIKEMYVDFLAFTVHGNVLVNNIFSLAACIILVATVVFLVIRSMIWRKWWKNPAFFVIMILLGISMPLLTNVILLISPNLTYHLLMRYQWVLYLILMTAFADRYTAEESRTDVVLQWAALCTAVVLVFDYGISDNIGYSNLEKKYEKTYAYCVRLLDRIEQTPGYYQGIPIALVGVIGYDEFPTTDITGKVTDGMIGLSGDYLIYKGADYQAFMQNYLGATLNFLDPDTVGEIYMTQEYIDMDTFPGPNATKVVDGILYVKTENCGRD